MAAIITFSAFASGRFKIPLNDTLKAQLTDEIEYQQMRVFKLLLVDFYADFIADPTQVKYDAIKSLGLETLLKAFVYVNFNNETRTTTTGKVNLINENSIRAVDGMERLNMEKIINQSVDIYNEIVDSMMSSVDFPNYSNTHLNYTFFGG